MLKCVVFQTGTAAWEAEAGRSLESRSLRQAWAIKDDLSSKKILSHGTSPSKDPNSKFKSQFLLRVHHFHVIIMYKN
jgi:hypothetical protein